MRKPSLVTLAACLAIGACGGSSSVTAPGGASQLRIMLKDTPFSDARSVLVTFSEVSVHMSGEGGFTRLGFTGGASRRTCDLKKLTSSTDILAVGGLSPGHYTQIRLLVESAALYFDHAAGGPACAPTIVPPAGDSAALVIPSGEIKLNREFEIREQDGASILLDFDGDRSIHATGNGSFRMTPVIGIVSVE